MPDRTLSRTLARAALDTQAASADASATITARLPILFDGLVRPSPAGWAEWNRAYSEKVAAAWEGALAAGLAVQASALRQSLSPCTPAGLMVEWLGVADAALRPARKRVRANAARLGRRKRR